MAKFIQAIRGMNDILPEATRYWQRLEAVLRQIMAAYGYQEIRFPVVESTELFKRSIGEVTDIVEKEMYTFTDRNGDSLTLRPEGTAGCVRAGLEHGLLYNQIQRLWYSGTMYRHERPQKGRYREFYQVGVEAYGIAGPGIDAELIAMSARFWRALGIEKQIRLQINSLGTVATRQAYREVLIKYFEKIAADLDEDSQRRLHTNPLRILDSKNPAMQELIAGAPKMLDYLDEASQSHFSELQQLLKAMDIAYEVNPRLVRGLDYYSDTVFEWVTDSLGAQGTVCAGGRYDSLVEQLGGKATPAVGFALGLERLLLLYRDVVAPADLPAVADAYLIMVGDAAKQVGFLLAEQLHDALPNLHLIKDCHGGSFKSQFKRADKSGATLAFILGDEEVAAKTLSVKFLRETRDQQTMKFDELLEFLKEQ